VSFTVLVDKVGGAKYEVVVNFCESILSKVNCMKIQENMDKISLLSFCCKYWNTLKHSNPNKAQLWESISQLRKHKSD
jgi:hypothetical protein